MRGYLHTLLLLVAAMALLTGCTIFDDEHEIPKEGADEVVLNFIPQPLETKQVTTRAVDIKTAEEIRLHDVHIFLFDNDTDEQFYYHHLSNGNTESDLLTPGTYNDVRTATAYVLANVEAQYIDANKAANNQYTLDELQAIYQPIHNEVVRLPSTGMPMVGSTVIDWQSLLNMGFGEARQIDIRLYALFSRLDFNINLDSEHTDGTGQYPNMTIRKIGLYNIPKKIDIGDESSATNTFTEEEYFDYESTLTTDIYNNSTGAKFSFYMFENKQGVHTNYAYPDGIESHPHDKQKFKPEVAKYNGIEEKATYFYIEAIYTDYNKISHDVSYKLYVGANNTDNFNIKRNHQYKSNVTIKGLSNSDDNLGNTFDARITIDESQPFFVSLLHEREIDAHFAIVPMDIYLKEPTTDKMKISIVGDGVNFMKLQRVNAVDMVDPLTGQRAEGRGKLDYFYTDLITNSGKYGLVDEIDNLQHHDRIYIYIDENISLKARHATLNIYYNDDPTPSVIALEQHGLIPVKVMGGDEKTGVDDGTVAQIIFCESFEEYLDFYDPLQEYDSPNLYPGLQWGDLGKAISKDNQNMQYNFHDGKGYTPIIISTYGFNMANLTLNGKPSLAASYCANKNKRNPGDKQVVNYKWCLPGIKQVEAVLTTNYNRFSPIRDGAYYWSAAAGRSNKGYGNSAADPDRARATAAYLDGTTIKYAPSERDDKYETNGGYNGRAGGNTLRTELLRIRTIYHPNVGDVIDGKTYTGNAEQDEESFFSNFVFE